MARTFSVRRATEADGDQVLECLRSAFELYREEYTPDGYLDTVLTPATLRQRFATMAIWVAVSVTGEVVGTIAGAVIAAGEGHLRGMAVRPDWQGSGVAARLLESVEAELRKQGCSRITLDTTAPLRRAVRFYQKHGFRASGKVTDYFQMPLFEYVKEAN